MSSIHSNKIIYSSCQYKYFLGKPKYWWSGVFGMDIGWPLINDKLDIQWVVAVMDKERMHACNKQDILEYDQSMQVTE